MFLEFFNQNIWLFVALIIVFNLLVWSIVQSQVKGANTISALEMPRLQRDDKSVIVDVNTSKDFALSHIPDAINVPLEDISADNKALLKHKDNTVIVVCQSGTRSTKAAKQLVEYGFSNVTILRGGLLSWTKENLPVTKS